MIVWGTKGYATDLGSTFITAECANCHNVVNFQAQKRGYKFSLFFVPLFSIKSQYIVQCPICQHGFEVSKDKLSDYQING